MSLNGQEWLQCGALRVGSQFDKSKRIIQIGDRRFALDTCGAISGASPKTASLRLLQLLYPDPKPNTPKKKDEVTRDIRNEELRRRYEAGERVVNLAAEYGLTIQAVYKILRGLDS